MFVIFSVIRKRLYGDDDGMICDVMVGAEVSPSSCHMDTRHRWICGVIGLDL